METENFLALLWGFSLAVISLSFLINQKNIKTIFDLMRSEGTLILSGGVGVIVGVASILTYNTWSSDWTLVITILGWAILIKGIIRLFFPRFVIKVLETHKNKMGWFPFIFLFLLFLGCFLVYVGFSA